MSLLERYRANLCAVQGCENERHADSAVCRDDLGALWNRTLIRQADGTYIHRRELRARDETGAVLRSAA